VIHKLVLKEGWTPKQRENYCLNTVRDIFEKSAPEDRFTITDLVNLAHWDHDGPSLDVHTITKHVDFLVSIAEVKKDRDHNLYKYRRNGKVMDERVLATKAPNISLRMSLVLLEGRRFLRIQQLETDSLETRIVGGMQLDFEDLASLADHLIQMSRGAIAR
jgi:hypothetical protein